MEKIHKAVDGLKLEALQETLGKAAQNAWQEYKCKLITPMYGGGVSAGAIDTSMPIRPSSIRGQLRFWWRIANAAGKSSEALFKEECALWGGLEHGGVNDNQGTNKDHTGPQKSQVLLRVVCKAICAKQNKQRNEQNSDIYSSAGVKYAFGCAGIGNNREGWLAPGFEFSLFIRYACKPSDTLQQKQQQVEFALRLWAAFGGLGGRTRRGFGALEVRRHGELLPPVSQKAFEALQGQLVCAREKTDGALEAWKVATKALYEFRQGEGLARVPAPETVKNKKRKNDESLIGGRSYWPEADQLRRFTGRHSEGHTPEHAAGNVFPRAAFGLPVPFQFKDSAKGDPPGKIILTANNEQGQPLERLASPLIVRPYWNGERWQAMALLLPQWQAALHQTLSFREGAAGAPLPWPQDKVTQRQLAEQIAPMRGRGDNPLSAFLQYFAGVTKG